MLAVEATDVSKRYLLHRNRPASLREAFVATFSARHRIGRREDFWALRNVSFSVEVGEAVAFIGTNGSGKSTILKLITGITRPTDGTMKVNGRISALLELGAGFHPEFTGRENIFLNGAILGIPKRVIRTKINDIIEFSEIGRFIDNPVKTYSSGMYMRLAFSIAVNIDPEILVIDEILAVGDGAFQKKCLDQIRRFQRLGKTILFVSHDLAAVKSLCKRAIWINNGHVLEDGDANLVVEKYQNVMTAQSPAKEQPALAGSAAVPGLSAQLLHPDGSPSTQFMSGSRMGVEIQYDLSSLQTAPLLYLGVRQKDGRRISISCCDLHDLFSGSPPTNQRILAEISDLRLPPGEYIAEIDSGREGGGPLSIPFVVFPSDDQVVVPIPVHWHRPSEPDPLFDAKREWMVPSQ